MYVYNSLFKNRSYCVFLFCICRANIVSLKFNLQMVFANVPPKCVSHVACVSPFIVYRSPFPFPCSFPFQ